MTTFSMSSCVENSFTCTNRFSNNSLKNKNYVKFKSNFSYILPENLKLEFQEEVKEVSLDDIVQRIHELYLTNRSKFILQKENGYVYINKPLSNHLLKRHLKQEITIGVFSGNVFSKFMCFDVDMKEHSLETTQKLYSKLIDTFGIDRKAILISKSGCKGYHLEVFFDKPIEIKKLKTFYFNVLASIGLKSNLVEFRPTSHQGLKLPFSINRKNNISCDVVDPETFEILDIKKGLHPTQDVIPQNSKKADFFHKTPFRKTNLTIDNSITYVSKNVENFNEIFEKNYTDSQKNIIAVNNVQGVDLNSHKYLSEIIDAKCLLHSNTRHNMTVKLLNFFNVELKSKEIAVNLTKEIIENTFLTKRSLISSDTTLEYALNEVDRLAKYIRTSKHVEIEYLPQLTKKEIEFILNPKTLTHKSYLLALFLHWARLGFKDTFYMTYEQLNESLGLAYSENSQNKSYQKKILMNLEKEGYLEILSSNSKFNGYSKKPNTYKILFDVESGRKILDKLNIKNIADLISSLPKLFKEDEIKSLVSKNQFYRYFKKAFED